MCVAYTRRMTTTYNYLISRLSAIDTAGFFKGQWKENYYVCGAYKKKNDNNVQYLISRLSAIDTAGFFKGQWKENYYVCGAYKKKNDNNVRLPHISAVSYRYGWFLQR